MDIPAEPRFDIGTRFVPVGRKSKAVHTVVDIWTTTNREGDVVRRRYVATHQAATGHIVIDRDVTETTIARGQLDNPAA